MMKKAVTSFQFIGVALMPLSTMIFFSALGTNAIVQRPLAITLLLAGNMILLVNDVPRNIVFIVLQAFYFLFLVSGPLLDGFRGVDYFYEFAEPIKNATYLCYWLAVAVMWIYCLYRLQKPNGISFSFGRPKSHSSEYYTQKYDYEKIRFYARILFYISIIAYVIVILDKAIFRRSFTMSDYYAFYSTNSSLPSIIVKLGDCHQIALGLFLATKPTKKQAKSPLLIFLLVSALTVLYGVRNVVLLNLVFVIIYLVLRNSEGEDVWFSKRLGIFLIILTPFIMIFMQAFVMIRRYAGFNLEQMRELFSFSLVRDFFVSQSISSKILPYAMVHISQLGDQPVPYTFGTLYIYLRQNRITRLFTGESAITSNTVESALYGANLGSRLAYSMYRESFLSGIGMGGCFIADLYVDFSYIGVFIGTFVVCIFINKMTKSVLQTGSPFIQAFLFVAIRWLVYLPRDSYFAWAMQAFPFMHIIFVVIVMFLCRTRISSLHRENVDSVRT